MFPSLLLAATLWSAPPSLATTVVALDPVEQAAESTAVVEAVVGASVATQDARGQGFTDTTLHVREVLAGAAPAELAIRQMKGARPDGTRFYVIGDADLVEGTRIVAFVRADQDGSWYLTALNQSVWTVADDGSVLRSFDGLDLYENTARGVVPAIESPQSFDTYAQLAATVRGLTCEGGR